MCRFLKTLSALALGLSIAGCVTTQEVPLAPNVVRLDTQASGLLFAGQATGQTMRRAAELTLQSGYSHFRLEQAQVAQGSELAGIYSAGSASVYGNASGANAYDTGFSTPIMKPTASVGVTVVMFHADEAGAEGAFDAKAVLAKYSQ
jgi:hypothetical protein